MYWLQCPNLTNINTVITNTIPQFFHPTWLETTQAQLHELYNKLYNHECLVLNNTRHNNTNIYTTIQGFIPITLIQTIREYTDSNDIAITLTIKFLLQISHNIYDQIWKPYCEKVAEWKHNNNIPTQPVYNQRNTTTPHSSSFHYTRLTYTYNCTCSFSDQQHTGNYYEICPILSKIMQKTSR